MCMWPLKSLELGVCYRYGSSYGRKCVRSMCAGIPNGRSEKDPYDDSVRARVIKQPRTNYLPFCRGAPEELLTVSHRGRGRYVRMHTQARARVCVCIIICILWSARRPDRHVPCPCRPDGVENKKKKKNRFSLEYSSLIRPAIII